MRVVHISFSDSGGAGLAALRLHEALLEFGVESYLLCFHKQSRSVPNVICIRKPLYIKFLEKLPIRFRNNKYIRFIDLHGKDYECLSFPEAYDCISQHPMIKKADVINLHWVGSTVNYKSFFQKVQKPIIWTLHDMNPFLGFAHYMGDIQRNPLDLNLEQRIAQKKAKWISHSSHLEIVCLCNWMKHYSMQSDSFRQYPQHIIRNSVNTQIYKLYNKNYIRSIFNIPNDKYIFLFVSQSVSNPRKGFDILLEAIKDLDNSCYLMVVGKTVDIDTKANIRFFQTIHDEQLMALIYSAADAFILPSREDNLPNTMLESLCCGTPVITMPTGGMVDIIEDGINGIMAKSIDTESLKDAIHQFIEQFYNFDNEKISRIAHKFFSPERQAKEYYMLYQSIIKNK